MSYGPEKSIKQTLAGWPRALAQILSPPIAKQTAALSVINFVSWVELGWL